MRQLDLQDGVRATLYQVIVDALKADITLQATIHPDGWRTYTDETDNSAPPGDDTLPAIEVLPFAVHAIPASVTTQDAPMGISINVSTAGLDVRDLLNLWEAVEGALFAGDGQAVLLRTMKTKLAALGRGQVASLDLTSPAITPNQKALDSQQMTAAGALLLRLRIPK